MPEEIRDAEGRVIARVFSQEPLSEHQYAGWERILSEGGASEVDLGPWPEEDANWQATRENIMPLLETNLRLYWHASGGRRLTRSDVSTRIGPSQESTREFIEADPSLIAVHRRTLRENDYDPMNDPEGTLIALDALETLEGVIPLVYEEPTPRQLEHRRSLRALARTFLGQIEPEPCVWPGEQGRAVEPARPEKPRKTAWQWIREDDDL